MSNAPAGFDRFWAAYPRRIGKLAALREWEKLQPPIADVLAALVWQVPTWDDPQFVPHPRTWLHQGRWMDEPDARVKPKPMWSLDWECPHLEKCERRLWCEHRQTMPEKYPQRKAG